MPLKTSFLKACYTFDILRALYHYQLGQSVMASTLHAEVAYHELCFSHKISEQTLETQLSLSML